MTFKTLELYQSVSLSIFIWPPYNFAGCTLNDVASGLSYVVLK